MGLILHLLFTFLACVIRQDRAQQLAYLKSENPILGSRLSNRLVGTDQRSLRR